MKSVDFHNAFRIFMCYVGAVIGAGFASGQEIMSFFSGCGTYGMWGIIISGILFFLYGWIALSKIRNHNIESFSGYFEGIAGKKIALLIQYIAYGFMFASFCVMISGSGAVAEELFGVNTVGILFMAILCFVVFLKGVDGMVAVNAVMTPLIIIGIVLISVLSLSGRSADVFKIFGKDSLTDNFVVSAIVYVSYNTVTLIGVFLPLKPFITSRKVSFTAPLLSGCVLATMGCLIWFLINLFGDKLSGADVPMLTIAGETGNIIKYLYAAVLYMAMITTAVSSGFALIEFLKSKTHLGNASISATLCTLSIPLAYVGFSNLVDKLYRFFGFVGAFVLFAVLLDGVRWRR
ncbi:MAG: hypothetical protein IKB50_03460 [Clostridia bacterium]|nr:hypothetical protein [Clostridia bacterium]